MCWCRQVITAWHRGPGFDCASRPCFGTSASSLRYHFRLYRNSEWQCLLRLHCAEYATSLLPCLSDLESQNLRAAAYRALRYLSYDTNDVQELMQSALELFLIKFVYHSDSPTKLTLLLEDLCHEMRLTSWRRQKHYSSFAAACRSVARLQLYLSALSELLWRCPRIARKDCVSWPWKRWQSLSSSTLLCSRGQKGYESCYNLSSKGLSIFLLI